MIRRCVRLLVAIMLLIVFLFPGCSYAGTEASSPRSLAAAALSSQNDTKPRPTTAAPTNGVAAKTIRHSTPAFLRAVSYNHNHSKPSAQSRSRDGNCGANAHLSPTEDQNIFPIGTLFLQWRITKTSFDPMRFASGIDACHLHVV